MSKSTSTGRNSTAPESQPAPPAADRPAHEAFIGDEHWGKGGRYIIDPATGRRVPAPDTTPEA
ncbi:MAG TPA: hypothetical protein VJ576_02590 [Rhodocyclaceae bacterium]|nr:hypothetical protein [Rhodocyclaceae bacterium]